MNRLVIDLHEGKLLLTTLPPPLIDPLAMTVPRIHTPSQAKWPVTPRGFHPIHLMIKALAHVCVYSSDLARTEKFYCGALGLSIQFRFIREGKLFGFYLKIADSQFIEVFYRDETASSGSPQIGHICLETDDIEHVRKVLTEHDIETTDPKLGTDHSWQMWCSDPDGTAIEFHQYTDQSTQRTGEDCIVNWC